MSFHIFYFNMICKYYTVTEYDIKQFDLISYKPKNKTICYNIIQYNII